MSDYLLRLPPGRVPFQPIVTSPYKPDIDVLLFQKQLPVRDVWRWLEDKGVTTISYIMLTRYRKEHLERIGQARDAQQDHDLRRDFDTLEAIIKRGQEALADGWTPRMSELLKAIELRAHLATRFPDLQPTARDKLAAELARYVDIINKYMTPEQAKAIMQEVMGDDEVAAYILPDQT
jgi:hypothetical protein